MVLPSVPDSNGGTGVADLDVVVVGAGFAGIYAVHAMQSAGLTVRAFEAGSGIGGTWFWNCYPGARCDVESTDYSYSFDPALEQEWTWSERYPAQPEVLRYLNHVADRYQLWPYIQLNTRVTACVWGAGRREWTVLTDDGESRTARFCVRRPAACRPSTFRRSRGLRPSAASGSTAAGGRTRARTSPASGSASSAPGRPASRSRRRSPRAPSVCTYSSARRTSPCRTGTGASPRTR
jgi:choline dehydrogenase-like flavoprotein